MIPDEAVQAAGQALQRYMVGDEDTECVPRGATIGVVDGWIRAIDAAVETAMPVVLTAAIPHLVTDEMVERAARELHRLSNDGLPFDLGPPHDPRRSVKWNDTRSSLIDRRRERYLTTARAALEAALGGAA